VDETTGSVALDVTDQLFIRYSAFFWHCS